MATWKKLAYEEDMLEGIHTWKLASGSSIAVADYEQLLVAETYILEETAVVTLAEHALIAVL